MTDVRVDRWCRERGWAFTREDAFRRFGRYAVERFLRNGSWYEAFRGILVGQPGPPTLPPLVNAAELHLGHVGVASHQLAAWMLGLDCLTPPGIHFTVSDERQGASRRGLIIHRTTDLPPTDVTRRKGHTCTGLIRTVVDVADHSNDRRPIVAICESLLRRSPRFRADLLRRVEKKNTGLANMDVLVELCRRRGPDCPPTESAAEAICDDILWRQGIRLERQHELFDASGEFVARLDFADPSIKYAIEVDGYATHKGRHAFYRDKRRVQEIQRCGWEVTPVVWDDLNMLRDLTDRGPANNSNSQFEQLCSPA